MKDVWIPGRNSSSGTEYITLSERVKTSMFGIHPMAS